MFHVPMFHVPMFNVFLVIRRVVSVAAFGFLCNLSHTFARKALLLPELVDFVDLSMVLL